MMQFLKKYRFQVILLSLLFILSFWFIPVQEDLYLRTDFGLLKKKSHSFLVWTIVIGLIIIFYFAIRGAKNIGEVGNTLAGVALLGISLYFVLQTIILSCFLALNRINLGHHVDKKYTMTFFLEEDKQTPVIYDFSAKRELLFDNLGNREKLRKFKTGDTIIISFNKGLLGFSFNPKVK